MYFCEICNNEYQQNATGNKKYCSRACKEKAREKKKRKLKPDYEKGKYRKRKTTIINKVINPRKQKGCSICGYSDIRALEFHHRDSEEKSFEISRWRSYTKATIEKELDKCDVVCANCHRIIHSEGYNG